MSEPVGWIGYQEDRLVAFLQNFQQVNQFLDATNPTGKVIPLYSHPMHELTDEEILDTARTMPVIDGATMEEAYVLFARAILSKAQGVNDKQ